MQKKLLQASLSLVIASSLSGCLGSNSSDSGSVSATVGGTANGVLTALQATPQTQCGPGSILETGLQGRVSQTDHDTGRTNNGFRCNTEVVGSQVTKNALGTVGGFKVERYTDKSGNDCAYYDSTLLFPSNIFDAKAGVVVLDMKDPTKPVQTASLVTPAMLSPHESLILNQKRGLLAAVLGNPAVGPGIVDIYDVSQDCRKPVLKSSSPVGVFGHESGMSPDGNTFWSASPFTQTIVAVDITNPSLPRPIWVGNYPSHGLSISEDGNRAYVASIGSSGGFPGGSPAGVLILDISQVQARVPNPQVKEISRVTWDRVSIPQNALPVTIKGKPYLVEIDEYSKNPGTPLAIHGSDVGAGRIIDISDEKNPKVISNLRLAVHQPANRAAIANDPGAFNPAGGYAGHYCNVPSKVDPTIVACSMILSGLRIFDIRDPANPVEVAYFNAPVNPRLVPLPAPASNWPMSSPAFVPERKEIWYTDGYSGFYAVKVTNGAWT